MTNEYNEEECDDCEEDESDFSELENEFKSHVDTIQSQIGDYLAEAEEALEKAVRLADTHGVSFYSPISFLAQSYTAKVLPKYYDLDQEFINEVTDTYSEYDKTGWAHSAVC
jgi:hypothetical protein